MSRLICLHFLAMFSLQAMGSRSEDPLPNKSPDEGLPGGEDLDEKGEWQAGPPVAELRHRPKDPRAKYKYNPFCRLFYL